MSDWNRLAFVLSDLLHGPLASIEILPGGLKEWEDLDVPSDAPKPSPVFPFVLVEGNLGVPKKVLYALYTTTVQMPWQSTDTRITIAISSVIILLNPAHQTALNARKRLIREGHLSAEKDLRFTELLCRGSPECGKQSMVWSHRIWCFGHIYGMNEVARDAPYLSHWANPEEKFPKMNPAVIRHELNIVYRTCETYPRNYHGWSHWHYVINICYALIQTSDDPATRRDFFGVILQEQTRLRSWVDHHVSDYSAVHQLCESQQLLEHLERIGLERDPDTGVALTSTALVDHAFSLVAIYPTHETLWLYLRVSLANVPIETRNSILAQIKAEDSYGENNFAKQLYSWFTRQDGDSSLT